MTLGQSHGEYIVMIVDFVYIFKECIRMVARVCNYIKFKTSWNLPPILKICA